MDLPVVSGAFPFAFAGPVMLENVSIAFHFDDEHRHSCFISRGLADSIDLPNLGTGRDLDLYILETPIIFRVFVAHDTKLRVLSNAKIYSIGVHPNLLKRKIWVHHEIKNGLALSIPQYLQILLSGKTNFIQYKPLDLFETDLRRKLIGAFSGPNATKFRAFKKLTKRYNFHGITREQLFALFNILTAKQRSIPPGELSALAAGNIHLALGRRLGLRPEQSGLDEQGVLSILFESMQPSYEIFLHWILKSSGLQEMLSSTAIEVLASHTSKLIGSSYRLDSILLSDNLFHGLISRKTVLQALIRCSKRGALKHIFYLINAYADRAKGKLHMSDVEEIQKVYGEIQTYMTMSSKNPDEFFCNPFAIIFKALYNSLPYLFDNRCVLAGQPCSIDNSMQYFTHDFLGLDKVFSLKCDPQSMLARIEGSASACGRVGAAFLLQALEFYLHLTRFIDRLSQRREIEWVLAIARSLHSVSAHLCALIQPFKPGHELASHLYSLAQLGHHRLFTVSLCAVKKWDILLTPRYNLAKLVFQHSDACFITLMCSNCFSAEELAHTLTEAAFRSSDFTALVLKTVLSCHNSRIVANEDGSCLVEWDIPDRLLDTVKIPPRATLWFLRQVLYHFVGISFDSSQIFWDLPGESLCISDYERIFAFLIERHEHISGVPLRTTIKIPKVHSIMSQYQEDDI